MIMASSMGTEEESACGEVESRAEQSRGKLREGGGGWGEGC